jgi:hypothetical protein
MLHATPLPEGGSRALLAHEGPAPRRSLEIDGSRWRSRRDFYDALSGALGSVERDCRSSASLLETMVYHPALNTVQPPYAVVIRNPSAALEPFVRDFARSVAEARDDRSADPGGDVEVVVTVA